MPPSATARAAAHADARSGGQGAIARRSFWSVLRWMALVAAGLHAVFVLLFTAVGLQGLALVNVASVALLLSSGWLLERRRNAPAAWLLLGETLAHAGVAVWMLGADSGFQYYVLLLVLPVAIVMRGSFASQFMRLLLLGAYFALIDAMARAWPPVHTLQAPALAAMRYFNIACLLGSMAFFSLTYARLISRAEETLRAMATTDPLTGLHNRRHMLDIVRRTPPAADADGVTHCVLLCDIDHFKAINDTHGHEAGDGALQAVARVLAASLREHDAVARWGGEEFLVLVRDADMPTALQAAERLRRAVAATAIALPAIGGGTGGTGEERAGSAGVRLTVTIGVARSRPLEPISAAIARADAALYRGKAAGRNRVTQESEMPATAAARASAAAQMSNSAAGFAASAWSTTSRVSGDAKPVMKS